MDFLTSFKQNRALLMEGAMRERLRREYGLKGDPEIGIAGLIYEEHGKRALMELWRQYLEIAGQFRLPFIAMTPTRKTNRQNVMKAGYGENIIADNVLVLDYLKQNTDTEMYIGGLIGDGETGEWTMTAEESLEFHSWQAEKLAGNGADFLYAQSMSSLPEAEGVAEAMEQTGLPYIVGLDFDADGMLPDGTRLSSVIEAIDQERDIKPLCYMARMHPHVVYRALSQEFNQTDAVRNRLMALEADPSCMGEADVGQIIQSGSQELVSDIARLSEIMDLKIVGGCNDADEVYLAEIARYLSFLK
ncbi:homocysteine S-methyltransferase family protein [Anaerolentibacter hominis]|uniref:homocysteine S-methyltransferase family protein n=1 Tax=Anaerolentibacter hominis TaxID=3079009 RepID=UPI0031B864B8